MKLGKLAVALAAVSLIAAGCSTTTSTGRNPAEADKTGGGGHGGGGEHGGGGGEHGGPAGGEHGGGGDEHDDSPRAHGNNTGRTIIVSHNGRDESHPVFQDTRNAKDMRRDPHNVIFRPGDRGHWGPGPVGGWNHFYPGAHWYVVWGYNGNWNWNRVDSVTCEAVDTATQDLFPVTGTRADWQWSDDTVNEVLDEALSECYASLPKDASGNIANNTCQPVDGSCFPTYRTLYLH